MTERAGLRGEGYSMGAAAADYDGDGHTDIYVTGYNSAALYRNRGDGTFEDVTRKTNALVNGWTTSAGWLDYDRDGRLDLFVASYIDLDLKTAPLPETGPCLYKGLTVACGPPGLAGGVNALYRNEGGGTFADV